VYRGGGWLSHETPPQTVHKGIGYQMNETPLPDAETTKASNDPGEYATKIKDMGPTERAVALRGRSGVCDWTSCTADNAARYGHIECLIYLHENGCPWSGNTCTQAAKYGNLECLKYAHENGCVWYSDGMCLCAAENGQADCLKYCHENGCPWSIAVCNTAAKKGHLECLKYCHENGCPWSESTCESASETGQLECLKYARENGCPGHEKTCMTAAKNGRLECLTYLHENGSLWDGQTCLVASEKGNISCLKYALDNGCPWTDDTCYKACLGGYLECLIYAHEKGCPWGEFRCRVAHDGRLEINSGNSKDPVPYHIDTLPYEEYKRGGLYSTENDDAFKFGTHPDGVLEVMDSSSVFPNPSTKQEARYTTIDGGEALPKTSRDELVKCADKYYNKLVLGRLTPYYSKSDKYECLKYAIDNGCPITT